MSVAAPAAFGPLTVGLAAAGLGAVARHRYSASLPVAYMRDDGRLTFADPPTLTGDVRPIGAWLEGEQPVCCWRHAGTVRAALFASGLAVSPGQEFTWFST